MARRLTKAAISRLLSKGLTGWEAGRLILQDFIDASYGKPSFLTDGDRADIMRGLTEDRNIRDYNNLVALGREIERGFMACKIACQDTCLDISLLNSMVRDANKKNTVELFMSLKPHMVTAKQYQDITAAQREKKLAFEYSLGYVIEERFYAIAPAGVRDEIEELGLDIESAESFAAAVSDKYADLYKQPVMEIHKLHREGKLSATYNDEDTEAVKPPLDNWKQGKLEGEEAAKLADMLFVTGQQLYDCEELPEWKKFIDEYQVLLTRS